MQNSVAVCALPTYDPALCETAVEKLFAVCPGTGRIGPDTKILLKPNLLAKAAPDRAVTTHPEIVRAVIHACVRRGAQKKNILVADSPGGMYNPPVMKTLYHISGLAEVCEQEGVDAYTACESVIVPAERSRMVQEFELLRPVVEADFIIDLPKLKTHVMTGLTAACKNLFGTIPGLRKAEWHTRYSEKGPFGHLLVDLLNTVKPDLAILDAVLAMEGDGPNGGEPRPTGLLMGSEDILNLDLACAELIGLDALRVPYLAAAHERGLCPAHFDHASLVLEPDAFTSLLPTNWVLPSSYRDGGTSSVDFAHKKWVPAPLRSLLASAERSLAPRPMVNPAACIGCGKCAEICPQHTIEMKDKKSLIHPKECIRCFCCHEMCPVKAIEIKQSNLLHVFFRF